MRYRGVEERGRRYPLAISTSRMPMRFPEWCPYGYNASGWGDRRNNHLRKERKMNSFMASGLLGVLGMSDQEWERAGERGELPSGEPEVASPVEQRSTATA